MGAIPAVEFVSLDFTSQDEIGIIGQKSGQRLKKYWVKIQAGAGVIIELHTFIKIPQITAIRKQSLTIECFYISF